MTQGIRTLGRAANLVSERDRLIDSRSAPSARVMRVGEDRGIGGS
jgi:hypothetical protein